MIVITTFKHLGNSKWQIGCEECPIKRKKCAAGLLVKQTRYTPPMRVLMEQCNYYEQAGYLAGETICNYIPKIMNKIEFANRISGKEAGSILNKKENELATENNLVAIFGDSDDLISFGGAIDDEYGAYEGGEVKIDRKGIITRPKQDDHSPEEFDNLMDDYLKRKKNSVTIRAEWEPKSIPGCSWLIHAPIPYAPFRIMKEGELFGIGMVIDLKEL